MADEHTAALSRVFSTTERLEAYTEDAHNSNRPLICNIGRGTCGTIYQVGDTNRAIKLGTHQSELWRDFRQTADAWRTVQQFEKILSDHFIQKGIRISVPKVPRCYEFHFDCEDVITRHEKGLASDKESVDSEISEEERQKPGYIMERIPPIPAAARVALVKELFDEEDQHDFLSNPENEDCLIRLYFGQDESGGFIDTLRNFPLYSDQMDDIGLDTRTLVSELAIGLAIVHWGAELDGLDGMDVEYVLSSSSNFLRQSHKSNMELATRAAAQTIADTSRRDTHLWILDFDKASPVSIHGDRVELIRRLVVATSGNDPYFPRPSVNKERWDQFVGAYVEAGWRILQGKMKEWKVEAETDTCRDILGLPEAFIEALEQQFAEEDAGEDDTFIKFED